MCSDIGLAHAGSLLDTAVRLWGLFFCPLGYYPISGPLSQGQALCRRCKILTVFFVQIPQNKAAEEKRPMRRRFSARLQAKRAANSSAGGKVAGFFLAKSIHYPSSLLFLLLRIPRTPVGLDICCKTVPPPLRKKFRQHRKKDLTQAGA